MVLNLDMRADLHMCIDLGALADIAVLSNAGIFPHMHLSPDTGTVSDLRFGRYLCRWVDINR